MQPDHKSGHRRPIRPTLLDIIAHAETDTGSDEVDILALLRAGVAAAETPADRLLRATADGRPGRAPLCRVSRLKRRQAIATTIAEVAVIERRL